MQAIARERYGPPSVLKIVERPRPTPKRKEVLIRVRAAEVTKADCELRSFKFPVKWFWLPLRIAFGIFKPRQAILGGYFCGEIVALGEEACQHKIGDTVYGSAGIKLGANAEFLSLPEHYTFSKKPTNCSDFEAAALPLGALNALHFLELANIKAGESVLINGAGGSIGLYAIQIAKAKNAHVTAVDKAEKEALIRQQGADNFIDYLKTDYRNEDQRYDVIFDMVARKDFSATLRCLAPKGRYLLGNPRFSDILRSFLSRKTVRVAFAGETPQELQQITKMVEAGTLRPVIDQILAPSQAAEAHQIVETESRLGSIVLSLNFDS